MTYDKLMSLILQVRHADVSGNAIGVFFGLGVALILETISIYYSGPEFWVVFSLVNIFIAFVFQTNIKLIFRFILLLLLLSQCMLTTLESLNMITRFFLW